MSPRCEGDTGSARWSALLCDGRIFAKGVVMLGLRIASVSSEVPKPGSAAEMHLQEIANGLERNGNSVTRVWAADDRSTRVVRLVKFQLKNLLVLRSFDVVYFRWHVLGVPQYVMARVFGIPYVLEINGTHEDIVLAYPRLAPLTKVLGWLTAWEFRGASHIIAVSPGLGAWASDLSHHRVPVTWIPNGAPEALARRRADAAEPPYAVFVGGLAAWQGIDILLEARRSPAWPKDVQLVVVGSGLEESSVTHAAGQGLVDYRGQLDRSEAQKVMACAAVSISPQTARLSRNRLGVTPLKVAESLMLGVPVVVSDLPGQAEIVAGSPGGRVVAPDSPDELAQAVAAILACPSDRDAIARYAVPSVSWAAVSDRTAAICARVHADARS